MPGFFEGFFARHKRGVTLAVLVLISLFGLMLSNLISKRSAASQPKEVGLSVMSFFEKGFTGFFSWLADTAGSIRQLRQAREELAAAEQRLQDFDRTNREIIQLRDENLLLRQQLELSRTLPPERIAAEVIAKDHDNLFSTITINKGSRHGVTRDMPVVAFQGDMEGLVGKVIAVSTGSSQVLPLYDPQCQLSARLELSRYEGLVSGRGKDVQTLLMRYVKKIAIDAFGYGDLVVTAGLGGIYPKGINIGRVRIIRARDYETSLELEIEPIIDFSRLEYVFVLRAAEETPQSAGESATQKPAASAAPPATPTTQTPATQKPAAAEPQVVKPAAPSPSRGAGLTPSPASDGAAVPSPSEDTVAPSPAAGSPPADSPPVSTPEPEAASPPGPSSESETGENGSPVTDQGAVQ